MISGYNLCTPIAIGAPGRADSKHRLVSGTLKRFLSCTVSYVP